MGQGQIRDVWHSEIRGGERIYKKDSDSFHLQLHFQNNFDNVKHLTHMLKIFSVSTFKTQVHHCYYLAILSIPDELKNQEAERHKNRMSFINRWTLWSCVRASFFC